MCRSCIVTRDAIEAVTDHHCRLRGTYSVPALHIGTGAKGGIGRGNGTKCFAFLVGNIREMERVCQQSTKTRPTGDTVDPRSSRATTGNGGCFAGTRRRRQVSNGVHSAAKPEMTCAKKSGPSAGDMKRRGRLSLGFRAGTTGTETIDQIAKAAIVPGGRSGHIVAAQPGAIVQSQRFFGHTGADKLRSRPGDYASLWGGFFLWGDIFVVLPAIVNCDCWAAILNYKSEDSCENRMIDSRWVSPRIVLPSERETPSFDVPERAGFFVHAGFRLNSDRSNRDTFSTAMISKSDHGRKADYSPESGIQGRND
jgi:hypothetical protein